MIVQLASVCRNALTAVILSGLSVATSNAADRTESMIQEIAAKSPPAGMSGSAWYEQKDGFIRELAARNPPVPNLAKRLAAIAREDGADVVTKDYILQHMQLSLAGRATPSERVFIREELREVVTESKDAQAGTALLALERMSRTDANVTSQELASYALDLIENPMVDKAAASVAIRVLTSTDPEMARQVLQKRIQKDKTLGGDRAAASAAVDLGLIQRSDCTTCGVGGGK